MSLMADINIDVHDDINEMFTGPIPPEQDGEGESDRAWAVIPRHAPLNCDGDVPVTVSPYIIREHAFPSTPIALVSDSHVSHAL